MASEKVKEHYDKNAEGNWVCKHCRQVLAKGTSLTRLKFHLSGEEGRGVRICKDVPPEVKQADYLSVESNKRQKTMPPHHVDVDVGVVKRTIPSSSREQPSHFDNGRGMHSESQHHLEPSVSVSSLLPSINVDFDNGGEMLSGFQHQPEPATGEQGMPLPTESRLPVEGFVAPKLTQGDALLTTNLVGEDFETYVDEIWSWLLDDNVTRIGIWGMAGVGKTALAKHVHNRLLHIPNQFDHIFWVTVSPDFTVHKLQESIGKALGVDLANEDDEHKRAAKLSKTLDGGGCKRCVFILDDVWDYLPLHVRVGIPASTKLIFTSRSLDVCRMIRCQKKIKIKPLSHEDGWELFKQILGQDEEALSPEILKLASLVSDRCDGLPLAIIWMSISMREVDDEAAWENALEKLKKSTTWQQNTEVFQKLKLSYVSLNDSALQQCFLYCAFYLGRRLLRKEVLIAHLIDEGIIRPKRRREAEYQEGHMMLKKLENACLLEVNELAYVKMNLVTWDLAYHVWCASCTTMIELWAEFEELPDVEEWRENLVRVSLMGSDIVEIPSSYTPRGPKLLVLLLGDNKELERIGNSFFEQFHKLKVLDLSGCIQIEKLPDSVSNLVSLTNLLLSECYELRHVPSLAKLRELKWLDLGDCSSLGEMPEGVGSLSKLKYLDLSGTLIEEIPSGIIANLSGLQVLKLIGVDVEGRELGRLRELETLESHFQHVSEFMEYMESRRECGKSLSEYTFLIGDLDSLGYGVLKFLVSRKAEVWISGCHDIKDISALKLNNTTQIEYIRIGRCEGIENLVSWSEECNTVKSLQYLDLYDLDNLRGLVKREESITAPTSSQFLSNLKMIDICRCHRLKRLFPPNLLPNLHNLERINIMKCQGMEGIFSMEEEDYNSNNCPTSMSPINLPNLTNLVLWDLPELRSIYSGVVNCHSLKQIELIHCPKLNRIPLHLLQSNSINIGRCHRLKRLFPPNLLPNLHNVQRIYVNECDGMEEIFSTEEEDDNSNNCPTSMSPINFPNLTNLVLWNLPELRSIYSGVVNCHSLKKIALIHCPKLNRIPLHLLQSNSIYIDRCHRLKRLFPPNLLPNLHNLKSIDINNCQGMEEIFSMEGEDDNNNNYPTSMSPLNLPYLTYFKLMELPELRSIYNGVVNCHSLKQIRLFDCPKLKRIPIPFPQPNSLQMIHVYPQEWWESLQWDDPIHKDNLQPHCVFHKTQW